MKASPSSVVAIIPARGGSKRIPRKNLLPLAGLPLVAHSIAHALQSRHVSEVHVSTDDPAIAELARARGVRVVTRPPDLASDAASSESVLLHALDERLKQGLADPDLVVFLQCTSPVRRPDDIDKAIETMLSTGADSLFSAREFNRLIWGSKNGRLESLNYDFQARRREQEMAKQYQENGSIYVFRPAILRRDHNRLGGKIAVHEMDYLQSFQIDAPEHCRLIEWIMTQPGYKPRLDWPEKIRLVVLDFDGVMTDNRVLVTEAGGEAVTCCRDDGLGIERVLKARVPIMVLSTETNPVVASRCAKLSIACHQGVRDKAEYLSAYLRKHGVEASHVVYAGNDINDLGCLKMAGMPVAVADAHPSVVAVSKLLLSRNGGHGAVRELCDRLLAHLEESGGNGKS